MYGLHVHREVLACGDANTGATVHLVAEEHDAGPILRQASVPINPADTPEELAARVQAAERRLLVATLADLAAPLPVPRILPAAGCVPSIRWYSCGRTDPLP